MSFDADFDAEVEVEDFDVEMFELDWLTECVYYLDIVVTVFDVAVAVVDVVVAVVFVHLFLQALLQVYTLVLDKVFLCNAQKHFKYYKKFR